MMLAEFSNLVGILGVILILWAYYLIQAHKVTAHSASYSTLNIIGAILILFSLCFHFNLASVVIEICWILISIMGIAKSLKQKSIQQKKIST